MYNGEPVHLFVFPFKARSRSLVSWQQTHKKPFVSFCSLTRIMDPLLCTSRNYILIHPSTSITVQCYEKLLRKGRSHEDFFLTLSKIKLEASFSFLTLPVPHSPPQIQTDAHRLCLFTPFCNTQEWAFHSFSHRVSKAVQLSVVNSLMEPESEQSQMCATTLNRFLSIVPLD